MPIPSVGGGYQVGGRNLGEIGLSTQSAPVAYTDAATLAASDFASGLITFTNVGAKNLTLPTVAVLEATVANVRTNSSFEFVILNLGGGTATVVTAAGWTLSGDMDIATTVAKRFLARKTGSGAWTLYQIA